MPDEKLPNDYYALPVDQAKAIWLLAIHTEDRTDEEHEALCALASWLDHMAGDATPPTATHAVTDEGVTTIPVGAESHRDITEHTRRNFGPLDEPEP